MTDNEKRYEWLKSRKELTLMSENSNWIDEHGNKFVCTHYLAAEGTQFCPGRSLDEIIDEAMRIQP